MVVHVAMETDLGMRFEIVLNDQLCNSLQVLETFLYLVFNDQLLTFDGSYNPDCHKRSVLHEYEFSNNHIEIIVTSGFFAFMELD